MTARLAIALSLVPSLALAHPGHGHTEPDSWAHYLTEPLHVGVLAAAAAVVLVARATWRRGRAPKLER